MALGLGSQQLATRLSTDTKSSAVEKLTARLNAIEPSNLWYDRFVDALAQQLTSGEFPRVIIIDEFEGLDNATRHVITRYFKTHSSEHSGSEFWIIFEKGNEGDRFSNLVLNEAGPGYAKTKLFRQSLLSLEEKLELVRTLSKPAEAAEYDVVKRICEAEEYDTTEAAAVLRNYRARHPRKRSEYDDLDFLFLLSLTADNVFVTQRFLLKNLAEKTGLRPEVLSLCLPGSGLRIEEFRKLINGIRDKFGDFLRVEPDGDLTRLKTVREKTDVLVEIADELGLDAGLGHLFWALFWHDKQPQPAHAMWLRKLARHILNADTTAINDPSSYVRVRMRLFEAILFCVDNSFKSCLFSNITDLLLKGATLLQETELPQDDLYHRRVERLVQRCWAAYTLLGDEEILRVIVELYQMPGKAVNYRRDSSLLERMFFESIGLSPEQRKRITPELLEKIYGRSEADKPFSDYVRARSSWLALAAGRLVHNDVCKFLSALGEADLALHEIADSSWNRIQTWVQSKQELTDAQVSKRANEASAQATDDVHLIDLMSLSMSLWCLALRFNQSFTNKRFYAANPDEDDPAALMTALIQSRLAAEDFSQLIGVAENAALLAAVVKKPGGEQGAEFAGGSDYVMSALEKELCALSLASVLTAERYASEYGVSLTEQQISDFNSVIQLNAKTLEYSLPEVKSAEDFRSEALVKKVDSLMKLCGIIWSHFGTEGLSEFMNIKRLIFSSLCFTEEQAKVPTHNSLLHSLGPVMNRNDFAGVMANLAIAEALGPTSAALAANYSIRAADSALNAEFGKPIQDQLVLNAIASAHTFDYPLEAFVRHVAGEIPGQKSLLERLLASLRTEQIAGEVLLWMNLANDLKSEQDVERVLSALKNFAQTVSDEETRTDVESQIELFALRQLVKKGQPVNPTELLANWSNRKQLWAYAALLRLLLDNDYDQEEIREESLAILDRSPEHDGYSSYLLLSLSLARKLKSTNGNSAIPVNYLIKGHPRWESDLSPSLNIEVYQVLGRLDPENRSFYNSEIQKWLVLDMEHKHLKRLPRLISMGHFFLVFRYYFQVLTFWGLKTELSHNELSERLSVVPEQRRSKAVGWKNAGGVVPEPLVRSEFVTFVNSDFLAMGSLLFDSPCLEDMEFEENRAAFDQVARGAIDRLFEVMINLPGLPPPIRELLEGYSRMMSSRIAPPE
jgi:hypothetical protein